MVFAAGWWVFKFQTGNQISRFGRGRGKPFPREHPGAVSPLHHLQSKQREGQTADFHGGGGARRISRALKFEKLTTLLGKHGENFPAGFSLCSLDQLECWLFKHGAF